MWPLDLSESSFYWNIRYTSLNRSRAPDLFGDFPKYIPHYITWNTKLSRVDQPLSSELILPRSDSVSRSILDERYKVYWPLPLNPFTASLPLLVCLVFMETFVLVVPDHQFSYTLISTALLRRWSKFVGLSWLHGLGEFLGGSTRCTGGKNHPPILR